MELTPKTRKEIFLAAAGGQDVTTPTPITREEVFLDAIAKSGGGGGGSSGGGVLVVNVTENNGTMTCDKTAGEMLAAMELGPVVLKMVDGDNVFLWPVVDGSLKFGLYTFQNNIGDAFSANNANDYPVAEGK